MTKDKLIAELDRATLYAAGLAVQEAWDAMPDLPPLDFTETEREALARAALASAKAKGAQ